jgi:peptidyl-dipeptidase Dcp
MTQDSNPLLAPWTAPFGLPPFSAIKNEHYRGAFEAALAEHRREIDRIANDPAPPDFENTIAALERAGRALRNVGAVFWNLAATDTNQELQEIERDMSAALARHNSEISMNPALFARVDALFQKIDSLGLTKEQTRVLELTHKNFVRAGARLTGAERERMTAILERIASLETAFAQNVLADEASYLLLLEESDLEGLPDSFRASAAHLAEIRGKSGKYAVNLSRSFVEPFLQSSARRDLRETIFDAWTRRGENGGKTDNRAIVGEILELRDERARMLGFANYAEFKLDDTMAKTPQAVRDLMDQIWTPALAQARRERAELQALADAEGANFQIGAADWRYYAERLRKQRYDLDQAELRPYFELDKMIAAAFYVAQRLFGLRFVERHGLELYHEDVRAFEVLDADGNHVALFLGDYFARPSKRGGAWMSDFRSQEKLGGDVRPIVVNVLNFAKAPAGEPNLLSLDDAHTLFHEFGHALHGMLSDVVYPSVSGTNVARDFVELPSQLFEHWLLEPEVLRKFARRAQTDEPLPEDMLQRILAARRFNQGFASVEFCASAYVDLDLHERNLKSDLDVGGFERESLARIDMPDEIAMRHRIPHFAHIFAGDSYSAGYYSYLWAAALDADAYEAFTETGDPFAPEVARKLRECIYSAGGRVEAAEAYLAFRGRMPTAEPLLRRYGFEAATRESL